METAKPALKNILFQVLDNACLNNQIVYHKIIPRTKCQYVQLVNKDFS